MNVARGSEKGNQEERCGTLHTIPSTKSSRFNSGSLTHTVNGFRRKLVPNFLIGAAIVLLITAVFKLASLGLVRISGEDPLFWFLTKSQVLGLAAILEFSVAVALLSRRLDEFRKTAAVAWLAMIFLVYRLSLLAVGWHEPCGCLGNAPVWFGLTPRILDFVMRSVLAVLLFGSFSLLAMQVTQCPRKATTKPPVTMPEEQFDVK